ncbi:MAG: hypothetical protein QM783_11530 [Phycisphaerales bacterium]
MGLHRFAIMSLCGAALSLGAGGCAFQEHREQLAQLHASGQDAAALNLLQSPQTQKLYGPQDQVLFFLDRGALLLESGRPSDAFVDLDKAESIMDYGGRRNAGDDLAEWLVNDTAAAYAGEPYESIYVNVLKLLAQLTRTDTGADGQVGPQGVISGGATVEARRAAAKADFLRQRFAASQAKVTEEAKNRGATQAPEPPPTAAAPASTAGQFIESPLGTYLTAVTFMKAGETSLQDVAGRRLVDSIKSQGGLIGDVKPAAFESLGSLHPQDANVLVVAFSGIGPTKVPQRFGPIPIFTWPVYFELPVLRITQSHVASVKATLTPHEQSEANPPQVVELNLVENLSRVAEENHKRAMPLIYQRTLIRAMIRSGISFAATEALRRQSSRQDSDFVAFGATIVGLAAITALERADVRCWVVLPGQAHVALAKLPAGRFDATIEYLDQGGRVVDTRTVKDLTAEDASSALATSLTFTTR